MKTLPLFLFCLVIPIVSFANDWVKKAPEELAAEARKLSLDLKKQAVDMEAQAIKEERKLTADEKKYVELTHEESLALEKSASAFEKKQKRLAENYRDKAMEICKIRGPLAEKVFAKDKQPKTAGEKTSAKSNEKDSKDSNSAKLAEIERQQAELDAKKKALLSEPTKE